MSQVLILSLCSIGIVRTVSGLIMLEFVLYPFMEADKGPLCISFV